MKLATLRVAGTTTAARVDADSATSIPGYRDVGALLAEADWQEVAARASGPSLPLTGVDYAPVIPHPGKIICVGLNYASHIAEMGRERPEYPTLFAKWEEALTGPYDDIRVPAYAAAELDWEAELAVIIGRAAYQVDEDTAGHHIAGYSVANDYTMRDYQYRTLQWDQGKNFEKTTGFGPYLDNDYRLGGSIEARLDGELMQSATTDDLVFTPQRLISYISHIVTLHPGDVIFTGTTGGVGHARKPPRYIQDGQAVEVTIAGLGTLRNTTRIQST